MNRRISLPLQTRLAPITAVNAEKRTAELCWTTGARVKRYDWENGRYYLEELSLQSEHVRLGRLNSGGAPLLNTHSRWDLGSVLGVVEKDSAAVDGKRGTCTTRFSQREEVEPIFRDVKDKIIVNVSCGYAVHRMEQLPPDAESEGLPIYRAIDWEPMEVSLVPIGADAGAGVRSEEKRTYPCELIETKEVQMSSVVPGSEPDPEVEHVKPSAAELKRQRAINELCRHQRIPDDLREEFLTRGNSIHEVRAAILERLAKMTESTPIRSGFFPGAERESLLGNAVVEALSARMGGFKPSDAAVPYMNMRTLDIARMCLEKRDIRTGMMSSMQIAQRSLVVGDFPGLLSEAGNRALSRAYQAHQSGLTKVFRRAVAPDFRPMVRYALSETSALVEVADGGEYKYGAMQEAKESYNLKTAGRILGISRRAIVNDDLGAFTNMVASQGQMCAEYQANVLTALVHSNPTLSTGMGGAAVFSTANANLVTGTGSGSAHLINVDSLGDGIKKMRLQRGISGNIALGVGPRYLVVPAALEQVAKQYTSSSYTPAVAGNINPWSPVLEPIVEPRLDALSSTAWYLFADPSLMACFEYALLDGSEDPYFAVREGWEVDGLEFKVRWDLGAGATEYRGAVKNAGV